MTGGLLGRMATIAARPRVQHTGKRIYVSCPNGHYLTSIEASAWAGSMVEAMASAPARCSECDRRTFQPKELTR